MLDYIILCYITIMIMRPGRPRVLLQGAAELRTRGLSTWKHQPRSITKITRKELSCGVSQQKGERKTQGAAEVYTQRRTLNSQVSGTVYPAATTEPARRRKALLTQPL